MQTTKKIHHKKTPLFFSEINTFIPSLPSRLLLKKKHTENQHIKSYLNHYNIDFVNTHIAKDYFLWRSTVNVSQFHSKQPSTTTSSITTASSYHIVQHYWQTAKKKSKGSVIIVHGYLDHTGLYGRAIQWALTQGYDVLSFDLPGHGLSSGEPASISNFDIYSDILEHIIRQHQSTLTKPLIALGQSTGCAIICNVLLKNEQQKDTAIQLFSQAILLAPLVRSHHWRYLRYAYFLLRPSISSIQRKFVRSSHNIAFNQFIQHDDPLQASRIPLLWLGAMEQWYQTIQHHSQTCSLPLTIIQGTGDATVDWRYNIPALSQIFTHSQTHYIKGAQHHLANESPEYWLTVENYLTQHINPP